MKEIYQKVMAGVPDYRHFLTLEELDESSRKLAERYPDVVKLSELGKTSEGHPLYCLKIGGGSRSGLLLGCPHPNEPIGTMLLEYFTEQLASDTALLESLDYTWYVVKAWDADGLRRNEGWLKGPYTLFNYARNFFRPASFEQVDWTFPIDYKELHFHDVIPETEAVMHLIDEIKPHFIYTLHNAGFGGTYWYESEPTPMVYDALREVAHTYDVPLSLGEAEAASSVRYSPAIFECGGVRQEYDYAEKFSSEPMQKKNFQMWSGDNSAAYAKERYGSFTLLTELPYFLDRRIESCKLVPETRRELVVQQMAENDAMSRELQEILSISKDCMALNNHYMRAVECFSAESEHAALRNQICSDPSFARQATEAEKLDTLYISKFYKMLQYGMLVRANETELARCDADPRRRQKLESGYEKALESLKRIAEHLENNLNYSVVPIKNLVSVQLESMFIVLEYLKMGGTKMNPETDGKPEPKERFVIDDNSEYREVMEAYRSGDFERARQMDKAFVDRALQERDHCPCKEPCRWHGKCKECVIMHRGHQDHLPKCMQPILLKQVHGLLQLAETDLPADCTACPVGK